jgi:hypothetical protein
MVKNQIVESFIQEGVLILRNSSLKLKRVVDNTILQNYAVSPENISKCIKSKTENGFHLKLPILTKSGCCENRDCHCPPLQKSGESAKPECIKFLISKIHSAEQIIFKKHSLLFLLS